MSPTLREMMLTSASLAADGTKVDPEIWGEFARVQAISNDTGAGEHGVLYLSPYSAGFGEYSPKR